MMDRYQQSDPPEATSAINVLLGLWLIVSTWIFGFVPGDGGTWNSIIVGIAIAILAAGRFSGGIDARGLSGVNAMLGVWMIVSPFVYGYSRTTGRTWNSVISGIIVLVVALAGATRGERARMGSATRESPWAPFGWRHGAGSRSEGMYRGVGPRGYRRGDDQIRAEICERMADEARLDASDVEIRIAGGDVVLLGTVPDRFARRLAEELTESVPGVHNVDNELRLRTGMLEGPRKAA